MLFIFVIPFFMVSMIFCLYARYKRKNRLYLLFKPITTTIIIITALLSYFEANSGGLYITLISIGLILSLGGDIALMLPNSSVTKNQNLNYLLYGLLFFLVTHILYSINFIIHSGFYLQDIIIGFVMLISVLIFFFVISRSVERKMKFPVILYMLVISFMLVKAYSTSLVPSISMTKSTLIKLGATLFVISDILLAIRNFLYNKMFIKIILLLCYFLAQMFFAISCFF